MAIPGRGGQDPHRVLGDQAVHVEDGLAAGGLDLGDIPAGLQGLEFSHGEVQILEGDEIHHQPALGPQAGQGELDQGGKLPPGTANEDGVGVRPVRQALGGLGLDQAVIGDAEAAAILPGDGGILGVLLDGVDEALGAEARRLQTHGAGASADVPDDAVGAQLQAGQGQGAGLALGDQAPVGLALAEALVRQTEEDRGGGGCLAGQDDQIGLGKGHGGGLVQGAIGDHLLVQPAQVRGHRHAEAGAQTFLDQHAGDAVRAVGRAGENGQGGGDGARSREAAAIRVGNLIGS